MHLVRRLVVLSFVFFLGYLSPLNLTLGNGQVLLVDTTSPQVINTILPKSSPTVLSIPLPSNLAFCGLPVYTQAALFAGAPGYVLTNAQDWVLGK